MLVLLARQGPFPVRTSESHELPAVDTRITDSLGRRLGRSDIFRPFDGIRLGVNDVRSGVKSRTECHKPLFDIVHRCGTTGSASPFALMEYSEIAKGKCGGFAFRAGRKTQHRSALVIDILDSPDPKKSDGIRSGRTDEHCTPARLPLQ